MKKSIMLAMFLLVVIVGVAYADDILGVASAAVGALHIEAIGVMEPQINESAPTATPKPIDELSNPPEPWFPTPPKPKPYPNN